MIKLFGQIFPFWIGTVSIGAACFFLERIWPWRKAQKVGRRQIGQDVFYLVFNGHFVGIALAFVSGWLFYYLTTLLGMFDIGSPQEVDLLVNWSLASQFVVLFLVRDLLEWCVHNLLHRVPCLWEIHKLHHSIEELDWIGNFRFHWLELVVYKALTFLPLIVLGVDPAVQLWIGLIAMAIGNLNHSNLNISWGPLRYVLNSPRMHVWHHDAENHGKSGQNFAVVFSLWDWIFRTAYWPRDEQQPEQLGFEGMSKYPKDLTGRLMYPLRRWWRALRQSEK